MIGFHELLAGLRRLGLAHNRPIIVHSAMSSFGEEIHGGSETLLGALIAASGGVMAPTFTYASMVIPEAGPPDNALRYGSGRVSNRVAEFYRPNLPAARAMGCLPETLRRQPGALRSMHPILSFAGVGLDAVLATQTLAEPLAPLRLLAEMGGEVLLIGVDQRSNTSIHYAERLAGRKQFTRWALTPQGVMACPGYPGCSEGFNQLAPALKPVTRRVRIAQAELQAIPLEPLYKCVVRRLQAQPLALLCDLPGCERCAAVRQAVNAAA